MHEYNCFDLYAIQLQQLINGKIILDMIFLHILKMNNALFSEWVGAADECITSKFCGIIYRMKYYEVL